MVNKINTQTFNKLLNAFSENETEAGLVYTKLRDSLIRFFQLKGDSEPEVAADETLDRVAVKFSQNGQIDDFTKFSFGIARYVFLERIRAAKKEKAAAEGFYVDKTIVDDKLETDDYAVFRACFDKLAVEDKKLLQSYFAEIPFSQTNQHRQTLSDKYKISLSNLRIKVFRLRKGLEDCVKRKLGK